MAELTEAEAAVYDRQLRVWGVETQKRLNSSKVLIAGMCGLASETAKNIILAGVGTLTLMDSTPSRRAKPGNFLIPADCDPALSVAQVSASTLQDMNPLVAVKIADGMPENIKSAESLAEFNVVVLVGAPLALQEQWDRWTAEKGVAFYSGEVRGPFGHIFANLHEHTAFEREHAAAPSLADEAELRMMAAAETEKSGRAPEDTVCWEDVRDFVLAGSVPQMPPVSAAVGGILAQEVLKAISLKGEPICNLFFFSMADCTGMIEKVGC